MPCTEIVAPGIGDPESLEIRTDQVVARDEREWWLVVVLAPAHLLLGERDPRGLDADGRVSRAGLLNLAGGGFDEQVMSAGLKRRRARRIVRRVRGSAALRGR
jgi:hypothetical protein